jgi:hypothetical protein
MKAIKLNYTDMKTRLILIILGLVQLANAQWVSNYYGNGGVSNVPLSNAHGTAIAVDNNGFCYITGYVDEGNGNGNDVLVVKYDSQTGDTIWTRSFNGSANGDDQGYDITTDNNSNVYIVGTVMNTARSYDIVLLKYSFEGTLLWDVSASGDNIEAEDRGTDLIVDPSGNIYLTGFCTSLDTYTDIITQKYNSSGTLVWSIKEDGDDNLNAKGSGIAINSSGIYVIGYVTSAQTGNDIVLLKYDSNGNLQFISQYNGQGNAEDRAFGIAAEEDNVYIGGYITASASIDCITLKYNSQGSLVWARTYNGEAGEEDKAFGIIVDNTDGSVYITGQTNVVTGNNDYLTIAYSSAGDQQWTASYNGTGNGSDIARAIGIVTNNNNSKSIIVTGFSWGTNNDYDYATIRYNITSGSQQTVSRYSMTLQSNDYSQDVATDSYNNSYVTGYSQLFGNGPTGLSAATTIMYPQFEGSQLETENNQPGNFSLSQNYPNPFNPSTAIKFNIPGGFNVKLIIYDVTGRIVSTLIDQFLASGSYNITFTTNNLSSGIYFYQLTAGPYREVKKMTLVK